MNKDTHIKAQAHQIKYDRGLKVRILEAVNRGLEIVREYEATK